MVDKGWKRKEKRMGRIEEGEIGEGRERWWWIMDARGKRKGWREQRKDR